ncbi:MAG: hypothetical protein ACON43_07620 [Flavobacteriaceae bacterium]
MQLENGGQVDLSSFLSKPQQLRLESNLLSLENGGQVDLSEFIDLPQQLHLNELILQLDRGGSEDLSNLLSEIPEPQILQWQSVSSTQVKLVIENGNSISLQASGNLIFSLTDQSILVLEIANSSTHSETTPFQTIAGVTRNAKGNIVTDHFLFGSTTMDNQTGAVDNSRFFFQKDKGAFRVGYASGASWDSNNVGDYSLAANYRTEAYGHRSVALGNATIAESFSETVLGSYNALASSRDKDDWVRTGRLFTIGNGINPSERSNAVVILKNGNFGFNTGTFGDQAEKVIAIAAGQAPITATTSAVQLYVVTDTFDRAALMVMDSAGNSTELSPHRFELISASEPMAWSYYAKNYEHKRIINVDMLAALRELEKLVGKPLVHQTDWLGRPVINDSLDSALIDRFEALQNRVLELEKEIKLLRSSVVEE